MQISFFFFSPSPKEGTYCNIYIFNEYLTKLSKLKKGENNKKHISSNTKNDKHKIAIWTTSWLQ